MNDSLVPPPDVAEIWKQHRRRIFDVGYRLLGSVQDAEDVVQEAYARLLVADLDEIREVLGWLVTVTSRLCLDRLRSHERIKRAYVGPWLPEPIVGHLPDILDVEDRVTLDDTVRMAVMVVLEQLSPAERVAFVLHDVFALDFKAIAELVGRSPQACRQLASRARRRIEADDAAARFQIDRAEHERVVNRFVEACQKGDVEALLGVLDPQAIGDFDSGGEVDGAPMLALDGSEAIADQLERTVLRRGANFEAAEVNGEPGVVISMAERVVAVISLGVRAGRIDVIHAVGNPAKLAHLIR